MNNQNVNNSGNDMNSNNGGNNNNGYNGGLNRPITGADIPLALKARYFASGMVVGVFVSPLVKKSLGKLQPKFDALMDTLTGQAEGLVEKGSDIVAKAKDALRKMDSDVVEQDHDHPHPPKRTNPRADKMV